MAMGTLAPIRSMRRYGPPWNDEAQFCGNASQVFRLLLEEAIALMGASLSESALDITVAPSVNAISSAAQNREPQVRPGDFNDSLALFEALMTLASGGASRKVSMAATGRALPKICINAS
jgi:hypothetical protein